MLVNRLLVLNTIQNAKRTVRTYGAVYSVVVEKEEGPTRTEKK